MNLVDILIIICVVIFLLLAIGYVIYTKIKHKGCSSCPFCDGCSKCASKNDSEHKREESSQKDNEYQ